VIGEKTYSASCLMLESPIKLVTIQPGKHNSAMSLHALLFVHNRTILKSLSLDPDSR